MTAKDLNSKLLKCFPEVAKDYEECVSWQDGDDTGSHIVFSCVFVPYIIKCANAHDYNNLQRCITFIETILSYKDLYSEEVIAFSVFENLMFSDELKSDIYGFLQNKSKEVYNEVMEWWKNSEKRN